MVRLFRGGNRRGRGVPRPPLSMMRHMRPHEFAHEFIPPYVSTRGRLLRGHPGRPGLPRPPLPPPPPPPTRMGPPPLPPLPHRRLPLPPPHVREMPRPMPMHLSRRPVPPPLHPMAPPMHPMHGPPIRRQMRMRPGPRLVRGRGGLLRRGAAVKRLGSSANGRVKKVQKRKEKTEEMEVNKPWVTEALKLEIHKKYQLYQAAKEKKTEGDWQAYKDQRFLVGKMTSTAKLEYIGSHPEADVDQIMYGATPKG